MRGHLSGQNNRKGQQTMTNSEKTNSATVICLCGRCASQFYTTPGNSLMRIDKKQVKKDICDFCNTRYGFDYYLFNKKSSVPNRKKHITGTFAKQLIKKYVREGDRIFTPSDCAE